MNISLKALGTSTIILCLLLGISNALEMNLTIQPYTTPMLHLPTFRFDDAGKYSFDVDVTFGENLEGSGGLDIFFCQELILTKLDPFGSYINPTPGCNDIVYLKDCLEAHPLNRSVTSMHLEGKIPSRDIYYIFLSNCLRLNVTEIKISGTFQTSFGGHISYGSETFPIIFVTGSVVWVAILTAYTFNAIRYRHKSMRLHRILNISTIFHIVYTILGSWIWLKMKSYGYFKTPEVVVDPNPNNNFVASFASSFLYPYLFWVLYACKVASTLFIIMVVSKGLSITRKSLLKSEWITIALITWLVFVTSLIEQFRLMTMPSVPYLFMLVVSLKYSFSSIRYNIETLDLQSQFISKTSFIHNTSNTSVGKKHTSFILFQTMLILYTFLLSIMSIVFLFFNERKLWVPTLLLELLHVSLYAYLFYLFRLTEVKLKDIRGFRNTMSSQKRKLDTQSPLLVIIQNPPTQRSGKLIPSFSLAPQEGYELFALKDHEENEMSEEEEEF